MRSRMRFSMPSFVEGSSSRRCVGTIVAKRKDSAYLPGAELDWLKIRNRNYSQWVGREELFERERESDPYADAGVWNGCVLACEATPSDFL